MAGWQALISRKRSPHSTQVSCNLRWREVLLSFHGGQEVFITQRASKLPSQRAAKLSFYTGQSCWHFTATVFRIRVDFRRSRIQLYRLMRIRIRIQRWKWMRIHADPDPGYTFKTFLDQLHWFFKYFFCLIICLLAAFFVHFSSF
jgi:hypothetical protein